MKRLHLVLACLVLSMLILSGNACADADMPMISCIHPGLWLALPFVMLVEWAVAAFVVRWKIRTALKVAFLSNIASTLVRVPLKWLLILCLTPASSAFLAKVHDLEDIRGVWEHATFLQRAAVAVTQIPMIGWGPPGSQLARARLYWAILLIPFFLLSVRVELSVARRLLGKADSSRAIVWAWIANALSYGLLAGLFWAIYINTWWWISRP